MENHVPIVEPSVLREEGEPAIAVENQSREMPGWMKPCEEG